MIDYRWIEKRGIHFLVAADGRIIAEVKKTSVDTYRAKYGVLTTEEYIELQDARHAMATRYEQSLIPEDKKKDEPPKAVEKKEPKTKPAKEKKSAGKDA